MTEPFCMVFFLILYDYLIVVSRAGIDLMAGWKVHQMISGGAHMVYAHMGHVNDRRINREICQWYINGGSYLIVLYNSSL